MAVYIDRPKPIWFHGKERRFVHLAADSLEELHRFAERLGLPRSIFQDKPRRPHYDVFDHHIARALSLGATQVGNKELLLILKKQYGE
ncbi:MAG: DUF4031 domain-containing protein [Bacteroidetes bacterium]|jgi:hypothetical protein|nr:DUF4031 domain-containing protein [Bacteroidota bacterium]